MNYFIEKNPKVELRDIPFEIELAEIKKNNS
jgi:hypothetical protein